MGSVIHILKKAGEATVHTVVHTAHITVDGVEQAVSAVADETGNAVHDVVVNGKVIVKAGQKIV
jgi:type IV secretory pathway protease TraF